MTDLTRERELRERAAIFRRQDPWHRWDSVYDGEVAAFAQDEIASLQARLIEVQGFYKVASKDWGLAAQARDVAEIRVKQLEAELARARQAEREQCAKIMCDCCGKYAEYWEPAVLVNERWRHISKHKFESDEKPTTHLCDAAAIHEGKVKE